MQHLLLLHGAIGSSTQLQELQFKLSAFTVHLFDFPGHGGKELPENFSISGFAESLVEFLREKQITTVNIFGYSMGGYVSIFLAKHYPELVNKIATLATKFQWSEEIAAKEIKMLQPEVIEQKIPAFAQILKQRHPPQDWKLVLDKTVEMLLEMRKDNPLKLEDYASLTQICLVMLGDKDRWLPWKKPKLFQKHFQTPN